MKFFIFIIFIISTFSCGSNTSPGLLSQPHDTKLENTKIPQLKMSYDESTNSLELNLTYEIDKKTRAPRIKKYVVDLTKGQVSGYVDFSETQDVILTCLLQKNSECVEFEITGDTFLQGSKKIQIAKKVLKIREENSDAVQTLQAFLATSVHLVNSYGSPYFVATQVSSSTEIARYRAIGGFMYKGSHMKMQEQKLPGKLPRPISFYIVNCTEGATNTKLELHVDCQYTDQVDATSISKMWRLELE